MTSDEMRTFFREEINTAFTVFRGEIHSAIQASEERIIQRVDQRIDVVQQDLNQRIDVVQQDLNQRIDVVQQSVLEVKGNVALLDQKVDKLDHKVNVLDSKVGALERKVEQVSEVLDEATVKIADMQQAMFNLENKVDTYHAAMKQDVLRTDATTQVLSQQVLDLNHRLTTHIATPWNKAHPDPNSAA